jgi:hypothetical protein
MGAPADVAFQHICQAGLGRHRVQEGRLNVPSLDVLVFAQDDQSECAGIAAVSNKRIGGCRANVCAQTDPACSRFLSQQWKGDHEHWPQQTL